MPSLVVGGRTHPVLHVSQIAELLGLPAPEAGSPEHAAASVALLDAWLGRVRDADWGELVEPTPSRGRTLRNLTVNVFHPFELLPGAWTTGQFDWRPEEDSTREPMDQEQLLVWAEAAGDGWRLFLEREDIASRDPIVSSSRGQTSFSALVSFQHRHAAYHYRQLVHILGVEDGGLLEGLALPREVF